MAGLTLYEKLDQIENRYVQMTAELSSPEILNDSANYQKLARRHSELSEMVEKYREWKQLDKELTGAKQMVLEADDPEMKQMAEEEEKQLAARKETVERELKVSAAAQGSERREKRDRGNPRGHGRRRSGALCGRTLSHVLTVRGIAEVESGNPGKLTEFAGRHEASGGLDSGQKVYSKLKYESGVHRVQRVPATEQQGRIHTSAATVAVLPEADEIDIKIEAKDLRIDTFCSSGPGGQSVNTTYSAVRITHIPTGLVVSQQDEKSQIKNRAKAMRVLRARLYEMEQAKQHEAIAAERLGQIKTGDRSEKIRTYNFPQNRVTDHRIGLTLHQLTEVMDGKLGPFVDALVTHFEAERLKQELVEA